ncbi:hypothetical protein J4G33_10010 [Actinotalea sp. BY-33]|uniref:ABC3 transporter permease C-terminal domain-containing protein n=1 Tax=Actinotalea soli TaxID=2819234 RepID=A0A939RSQ3_9CELL|nr:FtsX-like permease family protein [Actinotalea soli]MBO1752137.1 hypothetical protein [Actinotalea soli]
MSASTPPRSSWAADLALGARMSVGGGRSGWARLALIAIGVGVGVAMLLIVASLPSVVDARTERTDARSIGSGVVEEQGDNTLLTQIVRSGFRDLGVEGRLLQAEGVRVPLPPGVDRALAPGEIVLSPALQRLMDSPDGEAIRGRWGDTVVGTIGPEGLAGPGELTFYLGTDDLDEETATRINAFGNPDEQGGGLGPELLLLGLVGLAVMIVPLASFIATAVRFGGEARDRRLAALRLVGADVGTTRRIAAGETLVGAAAGIAVGGLLLLVAQHVLPPLVPPALTFYPEDLRPAPVLAALVVIGVPVASVLVTLSAMRRVVVEPLGVVRRSEVTRRRLWWRILLPVAGAALLHPLIGGMDDDSSGDQAMVTAGVVLLLVGVALLLPWAVDAVVGRLGRGGVAWELAVRRLQLESGAAVRAITAIVVSVAGLIAIQGTFGAIQAEAEGDGELQGSVFQAKVIDTRSGAVGQEWVDGLTGTPGVRDVVTSTFTLAHVETDPDQLIGVEVGPCSVLTHETGITDCAEGDVIVVATEGAELPTPGTTYVLGEPGSGGGTWELPGDARSATLGEFHLYLSGLPSTIYVTPTALGGADVAEGYESVLVALDPDVPDAVDRLRTTAADVEMLAYVADAEQGSLTGVLGTARQALLAGTIALLVVVGASLLVNVAEQLRERRRPFAVLLAFGTRRRTLGLSVLWQVAIPVAVGITLAIVTGTALSVVLQGGLSAPIGIDWWAIGLISGGAALVVLLVTAASLPLLAGLTRSQGLQSE